MYKICKIKKIEQTSWYCIVKHQIAANVRICKQKMPLKYYYYYYNYIIYSKLKDSSKKKQKNNNSKKTNIFCRENLCNKKNTMKLYNCILFIKKNKTIG